MGILEVIMARMRHFLALQKPRLQFTLVVKETITTVLTVAAEVMVLDPMSQTGAHLMDVQTMTFQEREVFLYVAHMSRLQIIQYSYGVFSLYRWEPVAIIQKSLCISRNHCLFVGEKRRS